MNERSQQTQLAMIQDNALTALGNPVHLDFIIVLNLDTEMIF